MFHHSVKNCTLRVAFFQNQSLICFIPNIVPALVVRPCSLSDRNIRMFTGLQHLVFLVWLFVYTIYHDMEIYGIILAEGEQSSLRLQKKKLLANIH